MDLKSLLRMTVPKLREEAANLPDVSGTRGMSKDELVRAIAKAHGIDLSETHRGGSEKAELKKQIRDLRSQISQAAAKTDVDLKRLRRRVKRLKARTRRLAKGAAASAGPSSPESSGSAPPAA